MNELSFYPHKENLKKMLNFSSPRIYSLVQFTSYIKEVYRDLTYRCEMRTKGIDLNKFHCYLGTPFLISRLLFRAFLPSKELQLLSAEDFSNGFRWLFFDTIQNRIQFLFHLFDIKGKRLILAKDIAVVLRQFHMMNNYCNVDLLEKLLSNALGTVITMDYAQWKELLINNSDLFVLMMIYLTHYKPFQEENIAFYAKCLGVQGTSRDIPAKTFELLADSTELLYTYVNDNFKKSFEYEERAASDNDDDLKDLNAFEEDKKELLLHLNEISKKLYTNSPTKKKFDTQVTTDFTTLKPIQIERKKRNKEVSATTMQKTSILSQLRLKNGLIETIEGKSLSNKRLLNIIRTDCMVNLKGRLVRCNLNLINNELFVLKYTKKTGKKFKHLLVLKHFYISTEENYLVHNVAYFKIGIISDVDYRPYNFSFCFEQKESAHPFINYLKKFIKKDTLAEDYDIVEELDREETGTLLQAYGKKNIEKYLIKSIMKKEITFQAQFEQIHWELSVFDFLTKADHPHLLKAFEKIETVQAIYLVYEYPTEGQLLYYLEKNQVFSIKKIIEVFVHIASSISYLHLHGMAYGHDMFNHVFVFKIKKAIYYKLINYERAKVCLCQGESKPKEEEGCSMELDVWNLGCLLYSMIYGHQPFHNKEAKKKKLSFPDLLFNKGEEELIGKVKDVISGCLVAEVNRRLTLCQLLSECRNMN